MEKDKAYKYISPAAINNYFRKMQGTREEWDLVRKILNNIERRQLVATEKGYRLPVTRREANILDLFAAGQLNPKSFSPKN